MKNLSLKTARYFETFNGQDYYRDEQGNIYTKIGEDIVFCSNLKHGHLTEDKAEPYFVVYDIVLEKEQVI